MPGNVIQEGKALGKLAGYVSVKLSYSAELTNVLSVQVVVGVKQVNITPSIEFNKDSLV